MIHQKRIRKTTSGIVISRHINGITLNPREYLLDKKDRVLEFESVEKAKQYLRRRGVKSFDDLYFERQRASRRVAQNQ